MSFVFPSWETAFSPEFYESAKGTLETALNKGNKPPVIQGRIEVVELSMGTQPPTLTLLEIGDLSLDRFRGILRLGYQGDAWLEVRCRVQANPLSHNPNMAASSLIPLSTPLLASQPLLVPMTLRLSKLHLRAILILVVSASKGITLVFKNDPLQNVDVSSTFDSVEVIRGYLQQEIEGQLREMFREDLPGIIHRLSQRWLTGTGVGGRVEMPYRDGSGMTSMDIGTPIKDDEPSSPSDPYAEKPIFPPYQPTPPLSQLTPKRRALAQMATAVAARTRRLSTALSESPSAYTTFPDIEDYDPTYGLRPEGVPTHSGYEAFGRLWEKAREGGSGLGSLMRVPVGQGGHDGEVSDIEEEGEDEDSVEDVEENQVLAGGGALVRRASGRSRMSKPMSEEEDQVEWETYPAVGGGMITRPRVYHAQSQIRAPSEVGGGQGAVPSPSGTAGGGSITARASSVGGTSTIGSMRRQATGLRTPGSALGLGTFALPQPKFQPLPQTQPRSQPRSRLPNSSSASALAGPGPSSLRRMVTSRSDVFLSRPSDSPSSPSPNFSTSISAPIHRQAQPPSTRKPAQRRQSNIPSQLSNTSSWSTPLSDPQLSSSFSTLPSSTTSLSIPIPDSYNYASPTKGHNHGHVRSASTSFPPRGSIIGPGGITLPLNNSVSQLAALSHEAQTLSPYARGHEHIAVRSFPHLGRSNSGTMGPGGRVAGRELGMVGMGGRGLGSGVGMGMGNGQGMDGYAGYSDNGERTKGNRKRVHRLGSGGKKKDIVEIQGEVEDYMPLGVVSPHLSPKLSMVSLARDIPEDGVAGKGKGKGRGRLGSMGSMGSVGSMTGMAGVLMGHAEQRGGLGLGLGSPGPGMRPNLMRSPDSRSSYGFPQVRRYA